MDRQIRAGALLRVQGLYEMVQKVEAASILDWVKIERQLSANCLLDEDQIFTALRDSENDGSFKNGDACEVIEKAGRFWVKIQGELFEMPRFYNEPISCVKPLESNYVKTSRLCFQAVLCAFDEDRFIIDFGDPRVWDRNRKLGSDRCFFVVERDKDDPVPLVDIYACSIRSPVEDRMRPAHHAPVAPAL